MGGDDGARKKTRTGRDRLTNTNKKLRNKKMNAYAINRPLCFLALSFGALVFITASGKSYAAPAEQAPEVIALVDRAVIENLMVDYYSHIGDSSFNFSRYFAPDGVLDVNGIIATGAADIKALYIRAGGGNGAAPQARDPKVPPRAMSNMQLTNIKVDVAGDTATAEMFWSSLESETLISPPRVTEYGRDRTELVKQNGHWLIKHRVVTSYGGMPEGELKSYMNMKR